MDCVTTHERVAAYLDGQLAPAEAEQVASHIERCASCASMVKSLQAQCFQPLSAAEKASVCASQGFWDDMDAVLCVEMDEVAGGRAMRVRAWYSRRVGMPAPMVMAYAAAMLLAVAWGMQQRERALAAEVSVEHLGQQLEAERRAVAQPVVPQQAQQGSKVKVVTYTPQRGTF